MYIPLLSLVSLIPCIFCVSSSLISTTVILPKVYICIAPRWSCMLQKICPNDPYIFFHFTRFDGVELLRDVICELTGQSSKQKHKIHLKVTCYHTLAAYQQINKLVKLCSHPERHDRLR